MTDSILNDINSIVANLRATIELTLGDEIGTYLFPNNETDKAIALLGLGADRAGEYPPQGTKITGLEVILYTGQTLRIERRLGGFIQSPSTVITLKQFDVTKNTLNSLFLLLGVLDVARDPIRTLRDPYLGNVEVCQIEVVNPLYSEDSTI